MFDDFGSEMNEDTDLHKFDIYSEYGPRIGMTRLEVLQRAEKLGIVGKYVKEDFHQQIKALITKKMQYNIKYEIGCHIIGINKKMQ